MIDVALAPSLCSLPMDSHALHIPYRPPCFRHAHLVRQGDHPAPADPCPLPTTCGRIPRTEAAAPAVGCAIDTSARITPRRVLNAQAGRLAVRRALDALTAPRLDLWRVVPVPHDSAHARSRVPSSGMMYETPMTLSSRLSGHGISRSRHDYLRDLGNGEQATPTPAMGGCCLPQVHRRASGHTRSWARKTSRPRRSVIAGACQATTSSAVCASSSRSSVMGLGLPLDKEDE